MTPIKGGRPLSPQTGIRLSASAAAFPAAEPVDNLAIFQGLFGPDYEQALSQRGLTSAYPAEVIGLGSRQWTHPIGSPPSHQEETCVDLGIKAIQALLQQQGLQPGEIDMLLVATTTPHKITTSSACAMGAALQLQCPSLDIKAGCSSGLYALVTAALYVRAGLSRVLLVAAETPSKYANPRLPETVMGVGDGAVAWLLEPGLPQQGMLGGFLAADGELGQLVQTPGLLPPTHEAIDAGLYAYHGDASALKEAVPQRYLDAMRGALAVAGLTPADLDLFVPHQVNRSLTRQVAQALGIAKNRQYHNLHRHGSLAGAAVLVALHEARADGLVPPGARVGLNVVGGGLTWGALVWQF